MATARFSWFKNAVIALLPLCGPLTADECIRWDIQKNSVDGFSSLAACERMIATEKRGATQVVDNYRASLKDLGDKQRHTSMAMVSAKGEDFKRAQKDDEFFRNLIKENTARYDEASSRLNAITARRCACVQRGETSVERNARLRQEREAAELRKQQFEANRRDAATKSKEDLEKFKRESERVDADLEIAFSHYLSGRVNVLCSFADEIIENLDKGFSGQCVDGGRVERAESLMWFWLLGAYEVVRTMHQAKGCFSERLVQDLSGLKKTLATARMPAAKMEKPGKRAAVTSNRSPAGWDVENRDLLVNDPEERPDIFARRMLSEFDRVFSSVTKSDVLAHHEAAYAGEPNKANSEG